MLESMLRREDGNGAGARYEGSRRFHEQVVLVTFLGGAQAREEPGKLACLTPVPHVEVVLRGQT